MKNWVAEGVASDVSDIVHPLVYIPDLRADVTYFLTGHIPVNSYTTRKLKFSWSINIIAYRRRV